MKHSSYPVLEDLKIVVVSDDAKVFRVHSPSLKRLTLVRDSYFLIDPAGVVIDAPRLCFLSINDNVSNSFIGNNLESIAKLDMSLVFGLDEFDEASVSTSQMWMDLRGFVRTRF